MLSQLPDLLGSTKFLNVLRKSDINWIKISPYAPSQGGNWESMVKLFKNALYRILHDTRRLPSLIELQTFAWDLFALSMIALLLHLSNQPNDFSPITTCAIMCSRLTRIASNQHSAPLGIAWGALSTTRLYFLKLKRYHSDLCLLKNGHIFFCNQVKS